MVTSRTSFANGMPAARSVGSAARAARRGAAAERDLERAHDAVADRAATICAARSGRARGSHACSTSGGWRRASRGKPRAQRRIVTRSSGDVAAQRAQVESGAAGDDRAPAARGDRRRSRRARRRRTAPPSSVRADRETRPGGAARARAARRSAPRCRSACRDRSGASRRRRSQRRSVRPARARARSSRRPSVRRGSGRPGGSPLTMRLNMRAIASGFEAHDRRAAVRTVHRDSRSARKRASSAAISACSSGSPARTTEWQASDAQTRSCARQPADLVARGRRDSRATSKARARRSRAGVATMRIRALAERFDLETSRRERGTRRFEALVLRPHRVRTCTAPAAVRAAPSRRRVVRSSRTRCARARRAGRPARARRRRSRG